MSLLPPHYYQQQFLLKGFYPLLYETFPSTKLDTNEPMDLCVDPPNKSGAFDTRHNSLMQRVNNLNSCLLMASTMSSMLSSSTGTADDDLEPPNHSPKSTPPMMMMMPTGADSMTTTPHPQQQQQQQQKSQPAPSLPPPPPPPICLDFGLNLSEEKFTFNHPMRSNSMVAALPPATKAIIMASEDSGSAPLPPPVCDLNESMEEKKRIRDEAKIVAYDVEGDIEYFRCPICDQGHIGGRDKLTGHLREHQLQTKRDDGKHVCCLCGQELSSNSSLERHLLTHTNYRPFDCQYCNKSFTTNGNLSRHVKTTHDNHLPPAAPAPTATAQVAGAQQQQQQHPQHQAHASNSTGAGRNLNLHDESVKGRKHHAANATSNASPGCGNTGKRGGGGRVSGGTALTAAMMNAACNNDSANAPGLGMGGFGREETLPPLPVSSSLISAPSLQVPPPSMSSSVVGSYMMNMAAASPLFQSQYVAALSGFLNPMVNPLLATHQQANSNHLHTAAATVSAPTAAAANHHAMASLLTAYSTMAPHMVAASPSTKQLVDMLQLSHMKHLGLPLGLLPDNNNAHHNARPDEEDDAHDDDEEEEEEPQNLAMKGNTTQLTFEGSYSEKGVCGAEGGRGGGGVLHRIMESSKKNAWYRRFRRRLCCSKHLPASASSSIIALSKPPYLWNYLPTVRGSFAAGGRKKLHSRAHFALYRRRPAAAASSNSVASTPEKLSNSHMLFHHSTPLRSAGADPGQQEDLLIVDDDMEDHMENDDDDDNADSEMALDLSVPHSSSLTMATNVTTALSPAPCTVAATFPPTFLFLDANQPSKPQAPLVSEAFRLLHHPTNHAVASSTPPMMMHVAPLHSSCPTGSSSSSSAAVALEAALHHRPSVDMTTYYSPLLQPYFSSSSTTLTTTNSTSSAVPSGLAATAHFSNTLPRPPMLLPPLGGECGGDNSKLPPLSSSSSLGITTTAPFKKKNSYKNAPKLMTCPWEGCHQKFPWQSSLKRHLITHIREKPYKCTRCTKSFSTKSNRERHMERVHHLDVKRSKRNIKESILTVGNHSQSVPTADDSRSNSGASDSSNLFFKMSRSVASGEERQHHAHSHNHHHHHHHHHGHSTMEQQELNEEEMQSIDMNDKYAESISNTLLKEAGQPVVEPNPERIAGHCQMDSIINNNNNSNSSNHTRAASNNNNNAFSFPSVLANSMINSFLQQQQQMPLQPLQQPSSGRSSLTSMEVRYQCSICQQTCLSLKHLKRHERSHSSVAVSSSLSPSSSSLLLPSLLSSSSPAALSNSGGQQQQQQRSGFKCPICSKADSRRLDALQHLEQEHSTDWQMILLRLNLHSVQCIMEKFFDCSSNNDDSSATSSTHGGGGGGAAEASSTQSPQPTASSQRSLKCAICLHEFNSLQDLQRHHRSHSGARPFLCPICKKEFSLKHSMQRHLRSHSSPIHGATAL